MRPGCSWGEIGQGLTISQEFIILYKNKAMGYRKINRTKWKADRKESIKKRRKAKAKRLVKKGVAK